MVGRDDFAQSLAEEIDREYRASGNTLGWRFLYSPPIVLDGAEVALIGLNPGGSAGDPEHAEFAMTMGSAYRDEVWPSSSSLQSQVLALFARLGVQPDEVLAGNLVPFRSPDWQSLLNQKAAQSFGRSLWVRVLRRAKPSLVITMGKEANTLVSEMLQVEQITELPVGWGQYTASRGNFAGGEWIGLPHLSRFRIMTRPVSQPYLEQLFCGLGRAS